MRTSSARRRAGASQVARSQMPGSRWSQRPWVSEMSSASGWKTSNASTPPGYKPLPHGREHGEPLGVG